MPSDRKPPKPVRAWAIACHDGSALHFGTVSVTRRDAWAKFDAFWTRESRAKMRKFGRAIRVLIVPETSDA